MRSRIMDQAIASAPVDANNRPVLATAQIRELMGSVPNTVFEHLLEAVAAGESAPLMMQLNELLNAGHSRAVAGAPDGSLPAQRADGQAGRRTDRAAADLRR